MSKNFRKKIFILICWGHLFFTSFATAYASSNDDFWRFDSIVQKIEFQCHSHGTNSKLLVAQLDSIASRHPGNLILDVQALFWEAKVNIVQGINDTALISKCEKKAAMPYIKNHPFSKALLDYSLTLCYTIEGSYSKAFTKALESLDQFQKLNDTLYIIRALNSLGNIFGITKNQTMAINYYRKALQMAHPYQKEYCSVFLNLYQILSRDEKEGPAAFDSLVSFASKLEQLKDTGLLVVAYFNLGNLLFYKYGDLSKAYDYYQLCMNYVNSKNFDNKELAFALYHGMGTIYVSKKDLPKALQYSYAAKKVAEDNCNLEQKTYALLQLSNIYKKMNNVDSAYHYLFQRNEIRNKLANNSKTIDAYQAYISIFLESAEKELTIAEQAMIIKNKQLIFVIVLSVGALTVVVLILIYLQQKKKAIAKCLEQDKEIQHLQNDKIDSQIRELTTSSMLIFNKNSTFQQISEITKRLPSDLPEVNEIKQVIRRNLNVEKEQDNFMIHFGKVHPRFFEKLKLLCSDLTENNLRMCAYIRIGMSAKQIAQVLNISVEGIKKSRYRLKKQFGLGEDDRLDDFIRNI